MTHSASSKKYDFLIGSVRVNFCRSSPAQTFFVPVPGGLTNKFFCRGFGSRATAFTRWQNGRSPYAVVVQKYREEAMSLIRFLTVN
jgi:hypothetical protein